MLIIYECSMFLLSDSLLETLDDVITRDGRGDMDEKCRHEPCGGMQIVALLFGDFYQFPPVCKRASTNNWYGGALGMRGLTKGGVHSASTHTCGKI